MIRYRQFLAVVFAVACSPIDQPTSSELGSVIIEPEAGRKFGFQLSLRLDLVEMGWKAYSLEHSPKLRDSFRTVHMNRLLTLVVERPDTLGNTGLVANQYGGYDLRMGAGDPRIILHVYDDLPRFSFSTLVDTVRSVSHEVLDWELNGIFVKELVPLTATGNYNLGGFPHATTHVPRLIARGNGFLFFFNYWVGDDTFELETIVSTFEFR